MVISCTLRTSCGAISLLTSASFSTNTSSCIAIAAFRPPPIAEITVAAPGVQVLSLLAEDSYFEEVYSDRIVGEKYIVLSGTSMACPYVSGLAALIKANHREYTNEQIKSVIASSADDILGEDWDQFSGFGRINMTNAILNGDPEFEVLSPPRIWISHNILLFGEIDEGSSGMIQLAFKNNGYQDLIINSIESDHGSFQISESDFTLSYDESHSINVSYLASDSNGETGQLSIHTNDPNNPNFFT